MSKYRDSSWTFIAEKSDIRDVLSKPFEIRVGLVGGGQLGKMLIESALPWNVRFNVLDPDPLAPAVRYADLYIKGSLNSREKILELAASSDVITFEIEHIDVQTLIDIRSQGKRVIPDPEILKIIQDKSAQKDFFVQHGLPTVPGIKVCGALEWQEALQTLSNERLVLKSALGGYDGKGVWIGSRADLLNGKLPFDLNQGPVIIEKYFEEIREISVIVARNHRGEELVYPGCEMVFDPTLNLVDYLYTPSGLSAGLEQSAEQTALQAIRAMNGEGLFAVELFATSEQQIYINEIAPRPHNSGHHSIEANVTSQYEQLMRILLGLPLGDTSLRKPAVMLNLIGPPGLNGAYSLSGMPEALSIPGLKLHWYNKAESRPGRKMGHITVCADSVELALQRARQGRDMIRLEPELRQSNS